MQSSPTIPPQYEVVRFSAIDNVVAEAIRQAQQGAEEGTLVIAEQQNEGGSRLGSDWFSTENNLYAALILRPDYPLNQAAQLGYVSLLSFRAALAGILPPLSELRFRWPNDIMLNDRKFAICCLRAATDIHADTTAESAIPEWLVIGLAANTMTCPLNTDPEATSAREEGADEIDNDAVLSSFCRHFLIWINRWADGDLPQVLKSWRQQAAGIGEPFALTLPDEKRISGVLHDIDAGGNGLVDCVDGRKQIDLMDAFGLRQSQSGDN